MALCNVAFVSHFSREKLDDVVELGRAVTRGPAFWHARRPREVDDEHHARLPGLVVGLVEFGVVKDEEIALAVALRFAVAPDGAAFPRRHGDAEVHTQHVVGEVRPAPVRRDACPRPELAEKGRADARDALQ